MKKIIISMGICLIILSMTACKSKNPITHPYTQEYIAGQGNIQGNVNTENFIEKDSRFEIGADKDGMAVFKEPEKAYEALLEKYSEGLSLIKKEFDLPDTSSRDYEGYKNYGWQVETGTKEERAEALFVTQFLDIYENSFD